MLLIVIKMFTFHIGHLIVQKKFKADPASKKLKDFCKYQNAKKFQNKNLRHTFYLRKLQFRKHQMGITRNISGLI